MSTNSTGRHKQIVSLHRLRGEVKAPAITTSVKKVVPNTIEKLDCASPTEDEITPVFAEEPVSAEPRLQIPSMPTSLHSAARGRKSCNQMKFNAVTTSKIKTDDEMCQAESSGMVTKFIVTAHLIEGSQQALSTTTSSNEIKKPSVPMVTYGRVSKKNTLVQKMKTARQVTRPTENQAKKGCNRNSTLDTKSGGFSSMGRGSVSNGITQKPVPRGTVKNAKKNKKKEMGANSRNVTDDSLAEVNSEKIFHIKQLFKVTSMINHSEHCARWEDITISDVDLDANWLALDAAAFPARANNSTFFESMYDLYAAGILGPGNGVSEEQVGDNVSNQDGLIAQHNCFSPFSAE